jgi:hypothetical protein
MTQEEYRSAEQAGQVQVETPAVPATSESPSARKDTYSFEDFLPMLVQMLQNGTGGAVGRSSKTSTQSFSDTIQATVVWEANDFASGITWTSGSNAFTVTKAGTYLIVASLGWSSTAANAQYQTLLYRNSTQISQHSAPASGAAGQLLTITATDTVELEAGDTIHVDAWHNSGSSKSIGGTSAICSFSITQVA